MKKRGFTLIELMVVIAIIGLLAAIALPRFANVSDSAKAANVQGNISSLRTSIAMFYAKSGAYPDLVTDGVDASHDQGSGTVAFTDFYGKNALPETPATSSLSASNTIVTSNTSGNDFSGASKNGGWAYRGTGDIGDGAIRANLPANAYGQGITWSEF